MNPERKMNDEQIEGYKYIRTIDPEWNSHSLIDLTEKQAAWNSVSIYIATLQISTRPAAISTNNQSKAATIDITSRYQCSKQRSKHQN